MDNSEQHHYQKENDENPIETVSSVNEPRNHEEKNWAMFCHLAALATYLSIPFAGLIAPLVIWLMKKDIYPAVDEHGKVVLNFQISMLIYAICCTILVFVVIGAFLLPLLLVFNLVCIIIGSIKAANGELFKYPLSFTFIK